MLVWLLTSLSKTCIVTQENQSCQTNTLAKEFVILFPYLRADFNKLRDVLLQLMRWIPKIRRDSCSETEHGGYAPICQLWDGLRDCYLDSLWLCDFWLQIRVLQLYIPPQRQDRVRPKIGERFWYSVIQSSNDHPRLCSINSSTFQISPAKALKWMRGVGRWTRSFIAWMKVSETWHTWIREFS